MTAQASLSTQEDVIKAIADQVTAKIDETAGKRFEEVLNQRVQEQLKELLSGMKDDDPLIRKMRGWGTGNEQLVASKFSRNGWTQADVEFAYDLMRAHRGKPLISGDVHPGPSEELTAAFKAVSDAYYFSEDEARKLDREALDEVWPRIPKPHVRSMFGSTSAYRQARKQAYHAALDAPDPETVDPMRGMRAATMDTGQSGFGTQLVGAQYVGDLWDAAFQEATIAPLINSFEMTAPTAYLPVAVDMPEMLYLPESTSDVVATAQYTTVRTGSNRVTVTAKKEGFHQVWSGEMEEDSIIAFIPFLQRQLSRALAFYTDALLLLGDTVTAGTGNINSDDAAPSPGTKWYLAFDGIKKAALIDNTANAKDVAGALTLNTFRDLKNLMRDTTRYVDFGNPANPNDLIFVADPTTALQAALLDEVLSAKIMMGDRAGLLSGQVMSIYGSAVIGHMALGLTDTDGKYTTTTPATNDTKGQLLAFNRNGLTIGWRRRVRLLTEQIVGSDQTRLAAYLRLGLGRYTPSGAASGQEWAAIAYDLAV